MPHLLKKIAFVVLLSCTSHLALAQGAKWNYTGKTGPSYWGSIDKSFSLCGEGKFQSPIDITDKNTDSKRTLKFHYSDFEEVFADNSVQLNKVPQSSIEVDDKIYKLTQFHFHAPSEHTVNKKSYDLELHLVHQSDDNKFAAVGVFITEGKSNKAIAHIINGAQNKLGPKDFDDDDLLLLLPEDKGFYHYSGSLTTPPCGEGLEWFVLKQPIEASKSEIQQFAAILKGNVRPLQKRNNRAIEEGNGS